MSESIPRNLCSGVRQRLKRLQNGESAAAHFGTVPAYLKRRGEDLFDPLSAQMCRLGDVGCFVLDLRSGEANGKEPFADASREAARFVFCPHGASRHPTT